MQRQRASLVSVARIFTGRVHDGVIVADGLDLPEGAVVTVASDDGDDAEIDLQPEEREALDAAIADADRSQPVPFEEVLAALDRTRPRSQ